MERLRQKQQILLSPKDYFNGKRLPEKFSAPDNILMFHHDFSSNREISHPRYTLVIPHGKMRYLIDSEEYSIQSGNALLIFPGQVRYLMQDSQCYSRLFITFDLPDNTTIIVKGIDKQIVGQIAAQIREKRPPEPYLGKGIKYAGEHIRRKAGKTGK